jgi:hypothetical protein
MRLHPVAAVAIEGLQLHPLLNLHASPRESWNRAATASMCMWG